MYAHTHTHLVHTHNIDWCLRIMANMEDPDQFYLLTLSEREGERERERERGIYDGSNINQNILHMYVTWIECMAFVVCMQWHVIMQSDMYLPTCSTTVHST